MQICIFKKRYTYKEGDKKQNKHGSVNCLKSNKSGKSIMLLFKIYIRVE